jgi:CheY-like chemotaxis protein
MYIPGEPIGQEIIHTHRHHSFGATKKILVIDDDEEILMLNQSLLALDDYTVFTALSGEAALALLDIIPRPDLILLDFQMEEMSGPEFLFKLEKLRPDILNKVPVVFLSAMDRIPETRAVGFIRKPFDLENLLTSVRGFIENKTIHEIHKH